MYDVVVKNGHIMDGCGNPWFTADVGIKDGRVFRIGNLADVSAAQILDAAGQIVSPGFIDIHCHSDVLMFLEPREQGKILQGVTTEVIGNCGTSPAPVDEESLSLFLKQASPTYRDSRVKWNWRSVGEYLDRVDEHKSIGNVALLAGHGMLRIGAMGFDDRDPTAQELTKMKNLVGQALDEGAFGLSSGLVYPPGVFSKTDEISELCKIVATKSGFYATHIRNEADELITAVAEAIQVAELSNVSLEISHHKAYGRYNWGKCSQTLSMIDAARYRGLDVTCDVYPYIAASTSLKTLLPPWVHDGGVSALLERIRNPTVQQRICREIAEGLPGWENSAKSTGWDSIMIAYCQNQKDYEGKTLQQLADSKCQTPEEIMFRLLLDEEARVLMNEFSMTEDDVKTILRHPTSMVGSDAIPSSGKPHPRFYGTFPRVLAKYVREDQVLSLQEGVRKMTSLPAQKLGLRDRGVLREGAWADIVIFDPITIADRATFAEPMQFPVGIDTVLVNGTVAVKFGKYTGSLSGKALRKNS